MWEHSLLYEWPHRFRSELIRLLSQVYPTDRTLLYGGPGSPIFAVIRHLRGSEDWYARVPLLAEEVEKLVIEFALPVGDPADLLWHAALSKTQRNERLACFPRWWQSLTQRLKARDPGAPSLEPVWFGFLGDGEARAREASNLLNAWIDLAQHPEETIEPLGRSPVWAYLLTIDPPAEPEELIHVLAASLLQMPTRWLADLCDEVEVERWT